MQRPMQKMQTMKIRNISCAANAIGKLKSIKCRFRSKFWMWMDVCSWMRVRLCLLIRNWMCEQAIWLNWMLNFYSVSPFPHPPPPMPVLGNGQSYIPYAGDFYTDQTYYLPQELCTAHPPICVHSEYGKNPNAFNSNEGALFYFIGKSISLR